MGPSRIVILAYARQFWWFIDAKTFRNDTVLDSRALESGWAKSLDSRFEAQVNGWRE